MDSKDIQEEYDTPNKKVGERKVTTVKNLKSITSVIKGFDFCNYLGTIKTVVIKAM